MADDKVQSDESGNGAAAKVRPLPPVTFQIQVLTESPGDGFFTERKLLGLVVNVPLDPESAKAVVVALGEAIRQAEGGLQLAGVQDIASARFPQRPGG